MRALLTLPLIALLACAGHTSGDQSPEGLKTAAERFFRSIRWRDFTGAADQIVPAKRDAFEHARRVQHDERDLEITDYEIERITLSDDTLSGKAIANLSWMRIPSVTVKTDEVETDFVFQDGHWRVKSMDGGPFEELR